MYVCLCCVIHACVCIVCVHVCTSVCVVSVYCDVCVCMHACMCVILYLVVIKSRYTSLTGTKCLYIPQTFEESLLHLEHYTYVQP